MKVSAKAACTLLGFKVDRSLGRISTDREAQSSAEVFSARLQWSGSDIDVCFARGSLWDTRKEYTPESPGSNLESLIVCSLHNTSVS